MNIETVAFRDNRRNRSIPCGMAKAPYTRGDLCTKLAVVSVTDMGWEDYNKFRVRLIKYRRATFITKLPIMMRPLLCQEHLNMINNLPSDPKKVAQEYDCR